MFVSDTQVSGQPTPRPRTIIPTAFYNVQRTLLGHNKIILHFSLSSSHLSCSFGLHFACSMYNTTYKEKSYLPSGEEMFSFFGHTEVCG